jgi:hypothetical protein
MLSLYSSKGGVGCSVASAAVGLLSAQRRPTLLVDLHGELTSILGLAADVDGLGGWFRADPAAPDLLQRLEVPVDDRLSVLPRGRCRSVGRPDKYRLLADLLRADAREVVIDVGTAAVPAVAVLSQSDRSVLVTRACYLALRAARCGPAPDSVLLVREPGRALGPSDVSSALGAPVVASLRWDPAVARAVDAGLLARRVPRSLRDLEVLL